MIRPAGSDLLTAEEFIRGKFDLPEGGRWTELHAGIVTTFEPPDDPHGNVVRNLSRLLAEYTQAQPEGYACFELGFILERDPDTVYFPPVSYISSGPRFAETDEIATARLPALVVEIASTNDRRRNMAERVQHYLDWQVPAVWVADSVAREIHVFNPTLAPRRYSADQILPGGEGLLNFQTPVSPLFSDPEWWSTPRKRGSIED
jgi:Uma2 family endonuclease